MEINKITDLIENFAPLELQEGWDCSGWQISFDVQNDAKCKVQSVKCHCEEGESDETIQKTQLYTNIKKILLCVSVTQDIVNQAVEKKFDMIIAHHPLFFVPFEFNKNIPIYSAHTNLDKTDGGTTDTLIEEIFGGLHSNQPDGGGLLNPPYSDDSSVNVSRQIAQKIAAGDFLRLITLENEMNLDAFVKLLKEKLNVENLRVVNNLKLQSKQLLLDDGGQIENPPSPNPPPQGGRESNKNPPYGNDLSQALIAAEQNPKLSKIAFCAGSGADFLGFADKIGAQAFVTGDVKYHQALESNVIIIDIGHFESERPILKKIKKILEPLNLEVMEANEKSPFINY